MRWGFLVMVEELHGFATAESARDIAKRMVDQLRAVPQLLHLRSGTAYTVRPPRLIHTARLFGAINARDEAEAEAIIGRSIARATVVGDRQVALYFWPGR